MKLTKLFQDELNAFTDHCRSLGLSPPPQSSSKTSSSAASPTELTARQWRSQALDSNAATDVRSLALARLLDHTLLKADATTSQIQAACQEALSFGFAGVCTNSAWTGLVAQRLASKTPAPGPAVPPVPIAVVGFPLGAMHTKAKCEETRVAVEEGAQEIDMVLAVGWLKEQKFEAVFQDIAAVVNQCGPNVPTKLIIETALLNDVEKIRACVLGVWAGVKFVKTSTGFAANGATVSDVALMRNVVGDQVGVKASGGIRTAADALAMLQAGATRLGVSSSVAILNELRTGTSSAGSSCSY